MTCPRCKCPDGEHVMTDWPVRIAALEGVRWCPACQLLFSKQPPQTSAAVQLNGSDLPAGAGSTPGHGGASCRGPVVSDPLSDVLRAVFPPHVLDAL